MRGARTASRGEHSTRPEQEPNGSLPGRGGRTNDLGTALLDGIREGAFVADRNGEVRLFNPSAEAIAGRPSGAVVGNACSQALGCSEAEECTVPSGPSGRAWTERICRGTRADGRPLTLRLRMRWIWDEAGRPVGQVGLFSETSLQESLQKKLVAYERLASLGELASSLVHEVGNPVGVILGFARLLLQEEGRDPGGEIRERIYREAERCREIVGQVLDYARSSHTAPRPIPLNLGDLAREVIHLLSYRMKRQGVTWELDWAPETPLVEADPGEMKQVLLNVLLNAVEAMDQGGTVRVTGDRIEREITLGGDSLLNPRVTVVRNAWVEVRVADEGPGLGPVDPERVFEAFYTTKEKGGGLGLSVCRRILREWG